jgi:hypothetical protein
MVSSPREGADLVLGVQSPFPPGRLLLRGHGLDPVGDPGLGPGLRFGDHRASFVVLVGEGTGHPGELRDARPGDGCAGPSECLHGLFDGGDLGGGGAAAGVDGLVRTRLSAGRRFLPSLGHAATPAWSGRDAAVASSGEPAAAGPVPIWIRSPARQPCRQMGSKKSWCGLRRSTSLAGIRYRSPGRRRSRYPAGIRDSGGSSPGCPRQCSRPARR